MSRSPIDSTDTRMAVGKGGEPRGRNAIGQPAGGVHNYLGSCKKKVQNAKRNRRGGVSLPVEHPDVSGQ